MISKRFPYTRPAPDAHVKAGMPLLPLTLASEERFITVHALVDSGATLSLRWNPFHWSLPGRHVRVQRFR